MIITDFRIGGADGALGRASVDAEWTVEQVELAAERAADGFEAAGTGDFEVAGVGGPEADVLDDFAGSAMLFDEIGAAFDGEGRDLVASEP